MTSWLSSIRIIAMVIVIVLAAVSPGAAQEQPSKEDLEATIAALQTQAAELEPETTGAPASTPTAAGEWNTASVAGNGFEVLTPAPAGTVDVIAVGAYDGQTLPFIIHNNTNTAIEQASVQGTVLDADGELFIDADGELLAVDGNHGINPGWIEPGGIGVGSFYFDAITFPIEPTVNATVSYETAEARESFSSLEATVVEVTQLEDRFVGFLSNPHSTPIDGPVEVNLVCLAEGGSITSFNTDFTESASIPVGGQVPFQVTFESPSCEYTLIVADGYSF